MAQSMRGGRAEANARAYGKLKTVKQAGLLRLERGDWARFDAARGPSGLSRSAYLQLHLLPMGEAMAARQTAIELHRDARRIALSTFLGRALDAALREEEAAPSGAAIDEFDALFTRGGSAC